MPINKTYSYTCLSFTWYQSFEEIPPNGRFWPIVFPNAYNEGEEFLMSLVSLPDSLTLLKQSMPSVRVPEAPAMTTHTHTLLHIQWIFISQFCCWFCCSNWFWSLNGKTELHELTCTPFSHIFFLSDYVVHSFLFHFELFLSTWWCNMYPSFSSRLVPTSLCEKLLALKLLDVQLFYQWTASFLHPWFGAGKVAYSCLIRPCLLNTAMRFSVLTERKVEARQLHKMSMVIRSYVHANLPGWCELMQRHICASWKCLNLWRAYNHESAL